MPWGTLTATSSRWQRATPRAARSSWPSGGSCTRAASSREVSRPVSPSLWCARESSASLSVCRLSRSVNSFTCVSDEVKRPPQAPFDGVPLPPWPDGLTEAPESVAAGRRALGAAAAYLGALEQRDAGMGGAGGGGAGGRGRAPGPPGRAARGGGGGRGLGPSDAAAAAAAASASLQRQLALQGRVRAAAVEVAAMQEQLARQRHQIAEKHAALAAAAGGAAAAQAPQLTPYEIFVARSSVRFRICYHMRMLSFRSSVWVR